MTVADGYAEWSATRKNLSPNSRAVEGVMWERWIHPVIGGVLVQRFAQRDYHRMDDALIERGLAGKSRRNARATLRSFFEWSLQNGYVLRNVVALTDPPCTDDSKTREAFTAEEVRALLAVPDRLHPIWRLFFETGARRGEIAGLQDEDVEGCRIHIRRQRLVHPSRSWDQDRVYTRPTTKGRRDRTVVVSEEMGVLLRRWKAQRAEERLCLRSGLHRRGLGLRRSRRLPCSPRHAQLEVSRTREASRSLPHRGLHACRHTHAEMALAGGVRLDVVSRQLGHASVAITAETYGHPDDRTREEAARTIGTVLGEERGDGRWTTKPLKQRRRWTYGKRDSKPVRWST
jgi:integrase